MPICYCALAGCGALGGRSVDARTLKNHTRASEALHYQRARKTSQQEANEQLQEERIAQYFASLALSDDSENQRMSGDRMWLGEVSSQIGQAHSTETSSVQKSQTTGTIQLVLQRLSEIDAAVDVLRKDVTKLLASIDDGAAKSLIKDLSSRVKQLDNDLQRAVTKDYKNHCIANVRQSIGHKLSDVYTTLSIALEGIKAMKQKRRDESGHPRVHPNAYSSGLTLAY